VTKRLESLQTVLDHYREADGNHLALAMPPRLESWDAKSAPSQARLAAYLDHVDELVRTHLGKRGDVPLALELTVALPPRIGLTTGGYDLDNYLYPVVRRLGHRRITSARASKSITTGSSAIRIGPAAPGEPPIAADGWQFVSVTTTAPTSTAAWKHQIAAQIAAAATPAPDGPLELQVALAVASHRNWASLWKPAIDSLGAIIGVEDARRPFSTRDDRIVRLALHRTIDDSLANRVRVGIWWRSSARAQPSV
jgi:hypothetical protein